MSLTSRSNPRLFLQAPSEKETHFSLPEGSLPEDEMDGKEEEDAREKPKSPAVSD